MAKKLRTGFMTAFDRMQKEIGKSPRSNAITSYLQNLTNDALLYLYDNTELVELTSRVIGKEYFAYVSGGIKSRAVNKELYADINLVSRFLDLLKSDAVSGNMTSDAITSACYTIVMGLACYIDLTNKGDRQTPGTFFEYLVRHILARHFNINPSERMSVPIGDDKISLTMDLILEVDEGKTRYHVAIKNSTRERAAEIWAHQRILDKAFGENVYTGLFIGLSETKLDHRNNEVTEICVPEQWRAYQQFIARLHTIYYLDTPRAYRNLRHKPPYIAVKQFGELYSDLTEA